MLYPVTISAKGQVTLPKELREQLNLRAGDVLLYTPVEGGIVVTPKSTDFNDLAGLLGMPPNGPATLEDIDRAIAAEAGEGAVAPLRVSKMDDAA